MSEFPGLKQLGIQVNWVYDFVGYGKTIPSTPGQIAVDVGGALGPGVFDHHHIDSTEADLQTKVSSASELVARHPEYVYHHLAAPVLEARLRGQLPDPAVVTFRIVTHFSPDWDGIVSAHLIQHLIDEGTLPDYHQALIQYSSAVDQGGFTLKYYRKLKQLPETSGSDIDEQVISEFLSLPHVGQLAIASRKTTQVKKMEQGLALLDYVVTCVRGSLGRPDRGMVRYEHFWKGDACRAWIHEPKFQGIAEELKGDRDLWLKDKDGSLSFEIELPTHSGNSKHRVRALALTHDSQSRLNKYWARFESIELFVCPYDIYDKKTGEAPRVVISVPELEDQEKSVEERVCLRGLGRFLEEAESEERKDKNKVRLGPPRWPGVDNNDPWYDGRDKNYTICDTPREGTVLDPNRIVKLVRATERWVNLSPPVSELRIDLFFEEKEKPQRSLAGGPLPDWGAWSIFSIETQRWRGLLREKLQASLEPDVERDSVVGLVSEAGKIRLDAHPEIRWMQLHLQKSPNGQIQSLSAIRDRVTKLASGNVYSVWSWNASEATMADPQFKRELEAAGLGNNGASSNWIGNGRTISRFARELGLASKDLAEHQRLSLIMLYVASMETTLTRFEQCVGEHDLKQATALQKQFLMFQSTCYQVAVVTDPRLESLLDSVRRRLGIDRYYAEVEREISNLVMLRQNEIADRQWWALAVLSAFGSIQTADVVQKVVAPDQKFVGLIFGAFLATVILLGLWLSQREGK